MINKYQQGGAAPQQGGGILAQIQQLPQEQQQQLMQAFAQWAQQKGVDIQQLQSNPEALEQALGQFMQEMQAQQTQMAKHGAKLQYIKGLKHQCQEGEHLEYFAKGGVVGCGCVKNKKGGKAEPKKNALEQYKESKKIQLKKKECGGKMKKHQIGGTLETLRQSLGLEKKNLTKYQVGGAISPVQAFQEKQANNLTYKDPTIGGFRVNNGQFDVISAQEGDKLQPQNGTYNKLISIFKHMIPGFPEAVNMKNKQLEAQRKYEEEQRRKYSLRIPLQEPDNTPQQPIKFEVSNRKPSYQEGGEFGGSNKSNRFVPQPIRSIPETTVNGIDKRWHFDKRNMNLGNGRGISSEVFYDYYNGGNTWLGDNAVVKGGRTIYSSPKGNDTIYWNTPIIEDGWNKHVGNMLVGSPQPGAKTNFFKNLKRPLVKD